MPSLRIRWHLPLGILGGALLVVAPRPVLADAFNVFCVPSVDGISTCSGWSDGGTLTCVSSPGGVASCQSNTGRQFTCVQDGSGVTTCQNPQKTTGTSGKGDDCAYVGDGFFSCDRKRKNSPDLIPSPDLIGDPIGMPDDDVNLTIPSLIP
jgi:hypothetical protein